MSKNVLFNSIKIRKPKRNAFDLSHEKKLSMNMGDLVPIYLQEIVPGDKFNVNSEILLRMAPLVAPIMHRVNVYTHYFFVPNRLVYNQWEDFITGGRDGMSTPTFPKADLQPFFSSIGSGSLADYLGIPFIGTGVTSAPIEVSMLPFRAYQMIYNEYYRDQNLTAPIAFNKGGTFDSGDVARLITMRKRAWEKDYFTSALPWAQRAASGVNIPLEVEYSPISTVVRADAGVASGALDAATGELGVYDTAHRAARIENIDSISGVNINDLRRSIKLQEWLEKNARGGARYIEQILSHFGVVSSDARLQRPEYLGGGKNPIVISEVLNTAGVPDGDVQGNMSGHGISVGSTNGFKKYFEEHGYVIGIMSVLPRTAYQQGLDRSWQKFDKLDYFWPEFAHLGEQEILTKELFFDGDMTTNGGADNKNENVFGYQSRYAEYKFKPSTVHGSFRDDMNFWHMGRLFEGAPSLNTSFVEADPTTRIFAVEEDVDHLWVQIYHRVNALRPMPVFGTPML